MSERDEGAWARVTGKGVYPVEYASLLLNPLRNLVCPPSLLIRRMGLKPTDSVLEIGCGPGYFSPAVAHALPQGRLTLFDYQAGMLDIAEKRLMQRGLANYERHLGDAKALPFAEKTFDVAFMVTVLGEVAGVDAALCEAARVLNPGGRLSVTEIFGDPDFVPRDELIRRAVNAGVTFEKNFGPRFYYTCNFLKP